MITKWRAIGLPSSRSNRLSSESIKRHEPRSAIGLSVAIRMVPILLSSRVAVCTNLPSVIHSVVTEVRSCNHANSKSRGEDH